VPDVSAVLDRQPVPAGVSVPETRAPAGVVTATATNCPGAALTTIGESRATPVVPGFGLNVTADASAARSAGDEIVAFVAFVAGLAGNGAERAE
jgi:hypothetical protein